MHFKYLHLFSLRLHFGGLSLVCSHQLVEMSHFLLVFLHLMSVFYKFHFFILDSHLILIHCLFHAFVEGFELLVFLVENSDTTLENVILPDNCFGIKLILARFLQESVHIYQCFIIIDIEFFIDEIVGSTPVIDILLQIVFQ